MGAVEAKEELDKVRATALELSNRFDTGASSILAQSV
jgi:hypothetical protein